MRIRKRHSKTLLLDSGKCDKPMKRSKEAAGWECKNECHNCFCFIVKTAKREWEHLTPVVEE